MVELVNYKFSKYLYDIPCFNIKSDFVYMFVLQFVVTIKHNREGKTNSLATKIWIWQPCLAALVHVACRASCNLQGATSATGSGIMGRRCFSSTPLTRRRV